MTRPWKMMLVFAFLSAIKMHSQVVLPSVPPPDPPAEAQAPPSPPTSTITTVPLSVSLDLQSMLDQALGAVPAEIDADGAWTQVANNFVGVVGLKYKIWRDAPVITVNNGQISASVNLYYHAQVAQRVRNCPLVCGYSWAAVASCGLNEAPRSIAIKLDFQLSWTADYHLQGTAVRRANFLTCSVTALNVDVTPYVMGKVLPLADTARDKLLSLLTGYDFRPQLSTAWTALQTPTQLSGGLGLFSLNPDSLAVTPFEGSGTTLKDTIILTAHPGLSPSAAAAAAGGGVGPVHTVALPAKLRLDAASEGSQFQLYVDDFLPFADATAQAQHALNGKSVSCLGSMQCVINVEEVGGTWQVAYVKLRLSGDLQGTVYLTGDMGYDTNTDTFSLSNLKLTPVEVSGFTADVVTTLQDPAFLQTIAEKLKWPFGAKLERVNTRPASVV